MNTAQTNKVAYAIIRMIIGALMLYHGLEVFDSKLMIEYSKWDQFKMLPFSRVLVYIGKGLELLTGLFVMIGFKTKISSLLISINMFVICFFIGHGKFWYEDQHPFLFGLFGLIFFFGGSGIYSLDEYKKD